MSVSLQDLKNKLEEIENSLPKDLTLSDIPLQHNLSENYDDIDIEVYNNLGYYYSSIIIS